MNDLMVRSLSGRYRRAVKAEVLEVAAQYLAAALQRRVGQPMTSPSAVTQFLVQALAPRDAEVFCVMFLDNRHRLIEFPEMFRGTIDGSSVHPREVVRRTLELNAAAIPALRFIWTMSSWRLSCTSSARTGTARCAASRRSSSARAAG